MKCKIALLALAMAPSMVMAAEEGDKLWSGEANLSYIDSSGNTESTNVAFRSGATRDGEVWRNIYKLEASGETSEETDALGNKKEVRTAEKYFASAKAEYKFGESSYVFGLLEYQDDRFSGFDYEGSAVFGYGLNILKSDTQELSADAGVGYRQSKVTDTGDVEEEAVLRLGAVYLWRISENVTFDEDFSTEIGEEKTVTKSYTRLKVKINGSLNGFAAYEIKHNSEVPDVTPPDPEIKNSDRKFMVGLNYSF